MLDRRPASGPSPRGRGWPAALRRMDELCAGPGPGRAGPIGQSVRRDAVAEGHPSGDSAGFGSGRAGGRRFRSRRSMPAGHGCRPRSASIIASRMRGAVPSKKRKPCEFPPGRRSPTATTVSDRSPTAWRRATIIRCPGAASRWSSRRPSSRSPSACSRPATPVARRRRVSGTSAGSRARASKSTARPPGRWARRESSSTARRRFPRKSAPTADIPRRSLAVADREVGLLSVRSHGSRRHPRRPRRSLADRSLPDAPPEVSIEQPAADLYVAPRAVVAVRISASDDLAVREIDLVIEPGLRGAAFPAAKAGETPAPKRCRTGSEPAAF